MDLSNIIPMYSEITKETRRASYDRVIEGLGIKQSMVYTYLQNYSKGATAKELAVAMHREGLVASPERNSVHPRLNELIRKELVVIIGKKTCQFTSRLVAIYRCKI